MTDRKIAVIGAILGVGAICATIAGSACWQDGRFEAFGTRMNAMHTDIREIRTLLVDHITDHERDDADD